MTTFDYREQMDIIIDNINKITYSYHQCARLYGLSYNMLIVLDALRQAQPCTQKQISELCGLPKQSINTIVKDLHQNQYISYSQADNKKEKYITFTEDGKRFVDSILQPIFIMEERVLKRIGEKDSQKLSDTVKRFSDLFEQEVIECQKAQ